MREIQLCIYDTYNNLMIKHYVSAKCIHGINIK